MNAKSGRKKSLWKQLQENAYREKQAKLAAMTPLQRAAHDLDDVLDRVMTADTLADELPGHASAQMLRGLYAAELTRCFDRYASFPVVQS
jgi:hypothetical protein